MSVYKVTALALFCVFVLHCSCSSKNPAKAPAANKGFAVVELFTSEGCSSCPAAEAVLAKIHGEYPEGVYVMEFHVDYWNYIGWTDVYSSPEYTARQKHYESLFHLGSTYTPQTIVNGHTEVVGSDDKKLHAAIKNELAQMPLAALQVSAKTEGSNIAVSYTATNTAGQLLNIALVQKSAETNVIRGENSGRKLKHINVVRVFKTVDATANGVVNMALPAGLNAASCSVIAYMQDKRMGQVCVVAEEGIN